MHLCVGIFFRKEHMNKQRRSRRLTIIFDAENIQLQSWYKHCRYTFINKIMTKHDNIGVYRAQEIWGYADKISVYCKSNLKRANKDWNCSVRNIELNSKASQAADNKIVDLTSKLSSSSKVIIITNDKELFIRCTKVFIGYSIRQYHTRELYASQSEYHAKVENVVIKIKPSKKKPKKEKR